MIRGLYTGASGMVAQMHRMDALSNNLSNVDVTGYKKDISVQKAFPELLLRRVNDDGVYKFPFGSVETAPVVGKIGTGVEQNEVFTIFTQGAVKQTDNVFDLAIEGEGFFSVDTSEGERYTRNGAFLIDDEGWLVTKRGDRVQGEQGPIQLKKNNFVIDQDGNIYQNRIYADDQMRLVSSRENEWEDVELVDRLKLVDFRRLRYLQKKGNSYWESNAQSGDARIMADELRPKVRQGFLENSNVNAVTEMVQMIEVQRTYEANQKLIQSEDALLGRLLEDAVKV